VIDVMRGGLPPLDFETVAERAMPANYGGVELLIAGLSSIVGFKRLAGRPRDRNDLEELAEVHGELPSANSGPRRIGRAGGIPEFAPTCGGGTDTGG
jgi:hypothetical protein